MPGTALVTGAARRIGREIALALAEDGWSVALCIRHDRSDHDAAEVLAEIEAKGVHGLVLKADLRDLAAVEKLIPEAAAALGPVALLVNNASVFEQDDAASMTPASWAEHMEVNLRAPVFLAQALARQVPVGGGNVINIIDQRVWRPNPTFLSYTLSKMALWDATRVLAQALAPAIRVNGIGPGPTLANTLQSQADFEHEVQATILRRGTSPQEICAAIRFILTSPAMTGQMIALDGGQHLAWETPDVTGPTR
ncbi:MAG: SDR family oxidoreductase [Parvibaculum sp.]|uniref:SDR family oxidoreductase n=1 Tax=Parvibaculum sp. TaxID=2024848 RepID=UPI00284FDDED|nr:SDR family oxidoreductase [Parvibaculum sp.]MDR3499652.1 SDR family oxidoreductase [Parvibaculum sp.]